jgi:hypothetical protein
MTLIFGGSHAFKREGRMHLKDEVLSLGSFVIRDGTNVRF